MKTLRYTVGAIVGLWFTASVMAQTTEPEIVSAPDFILSGAAIAAGIDGRVTVAAVVDKDGRLKNIAIIGQLAWPCGANPKKELENTFDAIYTNLEQIRFSPGTKNGKPREVEISFTFAVGKAYERLLKDQTPRPPRIDAGIVNGKARSLPKPNYPPVAKARRIRGPASVFVLIGEAGKVITAGAFSGHHVFWEEARDAACRTEFSPTLRNGKPIQVQGVITYNFGP